MQIIVEVEEELSFKMISCGMSKAVLHQKRRRLSPAGFRQPMVADLT